MNDTLLLTFLFLATTCGFAAIGLLVRELVWETGEGNDAPRLTLRPPFRLQPIGDNLSLEESLNRWFERVTLEANLPFRPLTTALLVILAGLLPAALFLVIRDDWIAVLFGFALGGTVAVIVLMILRARRVAQMMNQLPLIVEQLARAVRAGESLDQALAIVAQGMQAPLGPLFREAVKRLELGIALPVALRSLYERAPLTDVQLLVTSLSVYREVGGQLATMLEELAKVMRERLTFRRQVLAATAGGRFAATILSLIPPAIFAYFYFFRESSIQAVLRDPLGLTLLGIALLLEVVGVIWVFSVARLKL